MNRHERRKLGKRGGVAAPPAPRAGGRATAISDFLLAQAGQGEIAVSLDGIGPVKADPLAAAAAAQRRSAELQAEVTRLEGGLAASPDPASALVQLARLHLELKAPERALACYVRALEIAPERRELAHSIAALGGTEAPDRCSDEYVRDLFDRFARTFDDTLGHWLDYRAPEALRALIDRALPPGRGGLDIVDLGCGTGLSGRAFRTLAARLDGIDLSPGMLAKARARKLYDDLYEGEIVAALAGRPQRYDLAIATDVLIYIGDLAPLFAATRAALRPAGLFGLSIEAAEADGFVLTPSGRYAHGDGYVRATAAAAGFDLASTEATALRTEDGKPVAGRLYAFRKSS
ncbi:MAG: methyltransferase [Ferrovibrionaceae bacterium]